MSEMQEKRKEYPKTRTRIRDDRLFVIDGITTITCFTGRFAATSGKVTGLDGAKSI